MKDKKSVEEDIFRDKMLESAKELVVDEFGIDVWNLVELIIQEKTREECEKELHSFAKAKEKSEMLWRSRGRIEACNNLIESIEGMKKEHTYDNYTMNRIVAKINWIKNL